MLRRHAAIAFLALATVFGTGQKAAEASAHAPRDEFYRATEPAETAAPALPADAPAVAPDESELTWADRIDARLADLQRQAEARRTLPASPTATDAELQQRLEALARGVHEDATVGIAIRELETGASVFEWDAERSLNPASNHKLLTAAAALELLGDDYRFETQVLRDGDALVLVGEGDPSLQLHDLEALAERVAASVDLSEIRRIVVDDTAFSDRRFGPGYDPEGPGVSYMAPSGALSLQFNTVEIEVRGAKAGRAVRVSVSPPSAHLDVRSTASGGKGGLSVQTWADGDRTVVDVRGHLPAGSRYEKRRRITDPGMFTGNAFAELLRSRGATGLSVGRGTAQDTATTVTTHRSEPLPLVLESALAYSNNFTTEQLLRTLGWRATGQPGSWDNGRPVLERYWAAAGLPVDDLVFENASGLSSRGRITAAALADLLAFATRPDSPAAALVDALPIAGRQGTLRGRLRHSRGRVRAKTGTLRGASALSGIIEAEGGQHLGFSILVNGPVSPTLSRRMQDRVVMALVEHGAAH
ncbi:MAG: D-alanyl-D-alanine carboxypeptidase/D-alanyl-D-alanine-endopeptidase [Myxococcota bacterium]